ncbi:hypothetical protein C9974_12705 [Marinobacter sp. B9-2]|nr:hypothetical protein C9974_12705 [Marinobacter sp. B9-2]
MRPVKIETQDIIQAGQKIKADGKRVTGYGLRQLLGGGDQKRLLSVWQSHQSEEKNDEQQASFDLPIELEETLDKVGNVLSAQIRSMSVKLNEVAVKSATRQVADITREYKELKDQTDAELRDAAAIIEELENQVVELDRKLKTAIDGRDDALERAEKDRERAISLDARMKEMAGIEEVVRRLRVLEEKPDITQ